MMNRTARYVGVEYDAARCMMSATKIGKKHKLRATKFVQKTRRQRFVKTKVGVLVQVGGG